MSGDYLNKTAKSANTFLGRWGTADVLLRQLPVSPRMLEVVLYRSTDSMATENLCLYFDPVWIEGFLSWRDAAIEVVVVDTASSPVAGHSQYDQLLEIVDTRARFRCFTESLEVKENVRLHT